MKDWIQMSALALSLALTGPTIVGCATPFQPASYTPATSAGNVCRNECVANVHQCIGSGAGVETCHGNYKSDLDLDRCFELCAEFHGGDFTPYIPSSVHSRRVTSSPSDTGSSSVNVCTSDDECGHGQRCTSGRCRR